VKLFNIITLVIIMILPRPLQAEPAGTFAQRIDNLEKRLATVEAKLADNRQTSPSGESPSGAMTKRLISKNYGTPYDITLLGCTRRDQIIC
jgi:hypothetical protein